jgi:hypothetical protein
MRISLCRLWGEHADRLLTGSRKSSSNALIQNGGCVCSSKGSRLFVNFETRPNRLDHRDWQVEHIMN